MYSSEKRRFKQEQMSKRLRNEVISFSCNANKLVTVAVVVKETELWIIEYRLVWILLTSDYL